MTSGAEGSDVVISFTPVHLMACHTFEPALLGLPISWLLLVTACFIIEHVEKYHCTRHVGDGTARSGSKPTRSK